MSTDKFAVVANMAALIKDNLIVNMETAVITAAPDAFGKIMETAGVTDDEVARVGKFHAQAAAALISAATDGAGDIFKAGKHTSVEATMAGTHANTYGVVFNSTARKPGTEETCLSVTASHGNTFKGDSVITQAKQMAREALEQYSKAASK